MWLKRVDLKLVFNLRWRITFNRGVNIPQKSTNRKFQTYSCIVFVSLSNNHMTDLHLMRDALEFLAKVM